MWHSDKPYLPDVVEGTGAWAEKNDKVVFDNKLSTQWKGITIFIKEALYIKLTDF